jgi:hypothetical protein
MKILRLLLALFHQVFNPQENVSKVQFISVLLNQGFRTPVMKIEFLSPGT